MTTKKRLALTIPVILAPMLYGLAVFSRLPATMATHWGFDGRVDGTMPRLLVVVGLPLLMLVFQLIIVIVPRNSPAPRFERVALWLIPAITVVAYLTTVAVNLGAQLDIRRIAVLLVAVMMLVLGNYLPTVPPEPTAHKWVLRHMAKRPDARRALRRYGVAMVGFGLLLLLSLFFSPLVSTIVLVAMIIVMLALPFL